MSDRDLLLRENATLKRQLVERSRSLAIAEARYDAVFNSAFNLMSICTLEGVVLDVNRAALDAAQTRIEDCVGKHLSQTGWFARNPVEAAKVEAAFSRTRGQFVEYESLILTEKKDWRLMQFTFRPVRSGYAAEARFIVFEALDISSVRGSAPQASAPARRAAAQLENS